LHEKRKPERGGAERHKSQENDDVNLEWLASAAENRRWNGVNTYEGEVSVFPYPERHHRVLAPSFPTDEAANQEDTEYKKHKNVTGTPSMGRSTSNSVS
jgi:hypothetical protein